MQMQACKGGGATAAAKQGLRGWGFGVGGLGWHSACFLICTCYTALQLRRWRSKWRYDTLRGVPPCKCLRWLLHLADLHMPLSIHMLGSASPMLPPGQSFDSLDLISCVVRLKLCRCLQPRGFVRCSDQSHHVIWYPGAHRCSQ